MHCGVIYNNVCISLPFGPTSPTTAREGFIQINAGTDNGCKLFFLQNCPRWRRSHDRCWKQSLCSHVHYPPPTTNQAEIIPPCPLHHDQPGIDYAPRFVTPGPTRQRLCPQVHYLTTNQLIMPVMRINNSFFILNEVNLHLYAFVYIFSLIHLFVL